MCNPLVSALLLVCVNADDGHMDTLFAVADFNDDGSLDAAELQAWELKMIQRRRQMFRKANDDTYHAEATEYISKHDHDEDGQLNTREVLDTLGNKDHYIMVAGEDAWNSRERELLGRLEYCDHDKDGKLSTQELKAFFHPSDTEANEFVSAGGFASFQVHSFPVLCVY